MNPHDLRIDIESAELGVREVTITALGDQGAIDLEMEIPRILKLLERDWEGDRACSTES